MESRTVKQDTSRESGTKLDRLVSLPEAALLLDISLAAVRKRVQRGQLAGVRRGNRWYIWSSGLDREQDTKQDNAQQSETEAGQAVEPESSPLAPLVEELRAETVALRADMTRLWDSVAAKDTQIAELHILLQRALERQLVLELPAAPPESPATPDPERPRRSGWRAWRIWG